MPTDPVMASLRLFVLLLKTHSVPNIRSGHNVENNGASYARWMIERKSIRNSSATIMSTSNNACVCTTKLVDESEYVFSPSAFGVRMGVRVGRDGFGAASISNSDKYVNDAEMGSCNTSNDSIRRTLGGPER